MVRLDVNLICPDASNNILKFKNTGKTFKHPFHVIADFESTLVKMETDPSANTQKYQKHVQNSFGLQFCSIHKEYDDDVQVFNSPDPEEVAKNFILELEQ